MILHTTYFGSVSWYRLLARATEPVYVEACENFVKQTSRTRCKIMTANGMQMLSVPVTIPDKDTGSGEGNIRDIRISDHNNWRHLHWQALCSAYGNSPFFEFYADDIRPFFEDRWEYLYKYNMDITKKMCELLDINPVLRETERFSGVRESVDAQVLQKGDLRPYYQVFQSRHGFVSDLSILDLLFNMGPESVLYLVK